MPRRDQPPGRRRGRIFALTLAGLAVLAALAFYFSGNGPTGTAQDGAPGAARLSRDLRAAVDPGGVLGHARELQEIADRHGGNRAAGTPGYDASARYVARELRRAGYDVSTQAFEFPEYGVLREGVVEVPGGPVPAADPVPMQGSAAGEARAPVRAVEAGGPTSGCEAADFGGLRDGEVALMRRGTCTFAQKALNAEAAGAAAALISNAGEPAGKVPRGSLGDAAVGIPVLGISEDSGRRLLALDGAPEVRVFAGRDDNRTTNVIAETPGGDPDRTVMLGAHLDSVPDGPGINDNGSGAATVLETALELAELDREPENKVRFAFWGAEELGLVGSRHYVEGLERDEVSDIAAYLNFDMVGSPNFVRAVYEGPDEVEDVFASYFEVRSIETEVNAALDGRSDHGPFQDAGVPTGGLFSGAGGEKTEDQQEVFGGEAGVPYDPCYHRACDDLSNLNREALGTLSDGAAHATAVLAQRTGGS